VCINTENAGAGAGCFHGVCGNTALTNASGLGYGMQGCSGQGGFYFDTGVIRGPGTNTCLGLVSERAFPPCKIYYIVCKYMTGLTGKGKRSCGRLVGLGRRWCWRHAACAMAAPPRRCFQ
jgi:hypothetical protein